MPPVIVIRLHPEEPTTGADFSSYLTGLTIEAWDASFTKPKVNVATDTPIGTATGINRIVQHWLPTLGFPPAAVATAVLEVTSPPPVEYADPDVVIRVTRGATLVGVFTVDYNVASMTVGSVPLPVGPPAANPFPTLDEIAVHLALPSPLLAADPNDVIVNLPKDGSPPNFEDLKGAVENVLAQDPGVATALTDLKPAQCRHIAFEIAWNRHIDPLPTPKTDLETMYTTDAGGFDEQQHQLFEADLLKQHAKNDAKGEILSTYIYSMVAAIICEQKSIDAATAGLTFPIQPGVVTPSGKVKEAEVVLQN
jgi:hypothetical protein